MGPRHTIFSLHYDPLDNLLMQVLGWKRVLLFPPDNGVACEGISTLHSEGNASGPKWHYTGTNGNQYNTSAVNVKNPDNRRFPNFVEAPMPYQCLIGPGDYPYIPTRWWYHVRSLEVSVSANVWWQ